MVPPSSRHRLYFDADHVCVGSDDHVGDYLGSEWFELPDDLDPVGLTLAAIREAEESLRVTRINAFVARRRAALATA